LLAGSLAAGLFSGTSRDPGQELCLRSFWRRGLDLADLNRILAKASLIIGLAASYAIVQWKLSTIVFDIRISHTFAPEKWVDTSKALLPEKISTSKTFETSWSFLDLRFRSIHARRAAYTH
jgi:hypothetical protein